MSIKNCQVIANGYDLDELAEEEFPYDFDIPLFETLGITEKVQKSILIGMLQGTLIKGFQKAIKLLADKKFSEGEMRKSFEYGATATLMNSQGRYNLEKLLEIMFEESLQQNEWDVEIEMETCSMNPINLDCNEIVERPKIDTDGCLILRRI